MGIKVANNAFATLASSITNSATSITLTTGQGARFPSLGAGDYFYATLVDTSNNLEIVKCTARSTDVLTVVRAQESTTARAYSAGDRIEIRLTAQTFLDATQALPTQTGNAGKYLKTDGTNATWEPISSVTPTAISDQANSSTGYLDLPSGTTAQRPGSPGAGMVRFNTTTGNPEWYDPSGSGQWLNFSQPPSYNVEYLVIAGGGGGSQSGFATGGGAGGAGGYRSSVVGESSGGGSSAESVVSVTSNAAYTVTVGAGGADRTSGSNSVFGTITSLGGGRGAGYERGGASSGGSGGGGAYAGQAGASGTVGQGYAGGNSDIGGGGGGGGAGGVGGNGSSSRIGGNGGAGITSAITGTAVARAGGGGGGAIGYYASPAVGGTATAGGGNGGSDTAGSNGTANTGGGGGGPVGNGSALGGTGGSGVVIIRYAGSQKGTGGTVTSSGGYTIHTFTSSGTFTA
jgi:hypothetical protein